MVTHIVCHKYTDREEAKKIAPMLKGLVGKVPGLISMEAGADFMGSGAMIWRLSQSLRTARIWRFTPTIRSM